MTQTTGHISAVNATVEVSTDNATWKDISGSANSISPDGGERMTGEAYTLGDTDTALIAVGKKQPISLKLRIIYTEETDEAAYLLDGYYDNKTYVYLRYRPKGKQVGAWQFVGRGYFTTPIVPEADSGSADILMVEATWFGTELPVTVQSS